MSSLRGALDQLDPDDPVAQSAVARLREECVSAKEALSGDTEVSIPVMLPTIQTEVRLTRAEFEAMIRPALADTLVVLNRALRSARIQPADLRAVLLVGGSSRIPLVAQLVGAELGRPVAVDVHPKHTVALGAAIVASGAQPTPSPAPALAPPPQPRPDVVDPPAPVDSPPQSGEAQIEQPTALATTELPTAPPSAAPPAAAPPPIAPPPVTRPPLTPPAASAGGPPVPPAVSKRSKGPLIALAVGVLAIAGIGGAFALTGGDDDTASEQTDAPGATDSPGRTDAEPTETTATTAASVTTGATVTTIAPVTPTIVRPTTTTVAGACTGIGDPCIEILSVRAIADRVVVEWTASNFVPSIDAVHPHFYWNNATAEMASSDTNLAPWEITDISPYTGQVTLLVSGKPADADGICGSPAQRRHVVLDPTIFDCMTFDESP